MNGTSLFKSGFWFGRLIWVSGGLFAKKKERLDELLLGCGVTSPEVLRLSAHQFVDVFARGMPKEWLTRYEVIVVNEFEDLVGQSATIFLRSIQSFCDFQMGHTLQIVLLSNSCISPDLDRFQQFKPVEILVSEDTEDPGEMNERLHSVLELAMRLTRVSVHRISERAAVFLETFIREEGDDDTLLLLIKSLPRAKNRELRLKDLMPLHLLNQAQSGTTEAPCF